MAVRAVHLVKDMCGSPGGHAYGVAADWVHDDDDEPLRWSSATDTTDRLRGGGMGVSSSLPGERGRDLARQGNYLDHPPRNAARRRRFAVAPYPGPVSHLHLTPTFYPALVFPFSLIRTISISISSTHTMSSAPIRQPRGPPPVSAANAFPPGGPSAGPPPPDAESLLRRNKTVATPRSGPPPPVYHTATDREAHRRSFGGVAAGSSIGMGSGAAGSVGVNGVNVAGGGGGGPTPAPVPGSASAHEQQSSGGSSFGGGVPPSRFRSGSFSGLGGVPSIVPSGHAGVVGVVGGVGVGGVGVGGVGVGDVGGVGSGLVRRQSARDAYASRVAAPAAEETLIETEAADEHDTSATERGTWGKGLARQSSLPSRRCEYMSKLLLRNHCAGPCNTR